VAEAHEVSQSPLATGHDPACEAIDNVQVKERIGIVH
jgi:hypothetical protein